MASCSRRTKQSTKYFYLFNCDETCNLSQVTTLLRSVEGRVDFKIKVEEHTFRTGSETTAFSKVSEETIPKLRMDYAVFMVHANDQLSFDEDCYGKIYKALTKKTGSADNVLVVIGGDKKYANSEEKQNKFISQSAFSAIKTQLQMKFIDGRQSFIFSWDDSHRPIHEEALLHYFDPSRRGQKFEHQQRGQPTDNVAEAEATANVHVEPTHHKSQRRAGSNATFSPQSTTDGKRQAKDKKTSSSPASPPSGTVLLSTRIRNGDISYDDGGARFWENSRTWRPPDDVVQKLKKDWASTAYATVEFITDDNGVAEPRVKVTPTDRFWNNCTIS
ncbi:hypothetical protein ABFA07_003809 [Porites harrisoni]